jgi:phosphohistidine phosphatase SixA
MERGTGSDRRWALIGALLIITVGAACESDADSADGTRGTDSREVHLEPRLEDLIVRLRTGGYVILLRHSATTGVDMAVDLADCSTQRNLSLEGRAQAEDVGAAIERFDIVVRRVLASPYCRTRQTARIAFGRVELTNDLLNVPETGSRDHRRRDLRRLLSRSPGQGANAVLVTHSQNIGLATGRTPAEGGALVVRPRRSGGFRIVAAMTPKDWTRLARGTP